MDYFVIKGFYHLVGHSPDGDSLKFEAANPVHWQKIHTEYREAFEKNLQADAGIVQLRLQGIDALETHYSPAPIPPPPGSKKTNKAFAPPKLHQPSELAFASTERMLKMLGVSAVSWNRQRTVVSAITLKSGSGVREISEKGKDRIPGFIVTNDIERKGRPISWAFAGESPWADGAQIEETSLYANLKQSFNYRLLVYGLVYPYFFMTLSARLRRGLMNGLQSAVRKKDGIWGLDGTYEGIALQGMSTLTQDRLIFPYLFRRLANHQFRCQTDAYRAAAEKNKEYRPDASELFLERFFEETNPYIFLIKEQDFVRLSEVVALEKGVFRLKTLPGNIVFLS